MARSGPAPEDRPDSPNHEAIGVQGRWYPERAAVNALVWGPPCDARLEPDEFADPLCCAVVAAVVELRDAGESVNVRSVHARLGADVHPADLVFAGVTAAGGRLDGAEHYLAAVADAHRRRELHAALADAAHGLTVGRPVDDVFETLNREAAA